MPSRSLAFVLLLVTAPALAMACGGKTDGGGNDGGPGSSSSSGGGSGGSSGGSTLSCTTSDMSDCITVPASAVASCPSGSTSVSSCPSSNQLGCCSLTGTASNGQMATVTTCYYCAGPFNASATSASTFSMACASAGSSAMWTAGDVASCGDGG